MKKFLLAAFAIIFLIVTGCSKKLTTYIEINHAEYLEKLENKESFPLVIGSYDCSACALYKTTMEKYIMENQVEVYYIDISKVSEEEYNSLKSQISFDGTPTTVFIENGKLTSFYNRIDGAKNWDTVKKFFENNNY